MSASKDEPLHKQSEFTKYADVKSNRFGMPRKGAATESKVTKKDAEAHGLDMTNKPAETPLLPYDFNSALYLEINTDVAKAGIEAAVHYVYQGIAEGRAYRYPEDYTPNPIDKDVIS